jgi:hypothetical protein
LASGTIGTVGLGATLGYRWAGRSMMLVQLNREVCGIKIVRDALGAL